MKKVLSLALSLLMLLSLTVPALTVTADTTAIFQIGDTTYTSVATLATAVNASTSDDPVEVKMIADYTGCTEQNIVFTHPFTLDGQSHTLSGNSGIYLIHFYSAGTFTVKNLTYKNTHGFRMYTPASGTMEVVFDNLNCTLTSGGLFTNQQTKNSTDSGVNVLTIKNSTITTVSTSGGDPVFAVYDGRNTAVINIIDSTVTQNRTYKGEDANGSLLTVNAAAKTTINLQGAKLITQRGTGKVPASILHMAYPANVKVNLDANTELVIDNAENGYYSEFIYGNAIPAEWNDNGATYTITKRALKTGATLPIITSLNGDSTTAIVYKSTTGDKTVTPGFSYGDHTATSAISFKAQATTGTKVTAYTKPFRIGTTYYDTYTAASAVVKAGETIEQLRNYIGAETRVDITRNAGSYTFDGNGCTFVNKTGYFFSLTKTGVTFKNITITNVNQGFSVNPNATDWTLNFDNVYAYSYNGLLMAYGHSFATNSGNGIVNLKNSYFQGSGEEPILMQNLDQTLNLVNSTIVGTSATAEHCNAVHVANNAKIFTINLDATSKLMYRGTGAGFAIYANGSASTTYLNLEAGATLEVDNATAGCKFINPSSNKMYVNDKGANFVANATTLKNGIVLPTLGNTTEGVVAVSSGDKTYKPGSTYKDTSATASKTFTVNYYKTADIANVTGASIRIANDEYSPALRFSATVTEDLYNQLTALDANVKFGTLVANASTMTTATDIQTATKKIAKDITVWADDAEAGQKKFNTAVYNIAEANYETALAATAYFTVTYSDGATQTFYAGFDATNNERSLAGVAQAAYDAGYTDIATINAILGK